METRLTCFRLSGQSLASGNIDDEADTMDLHCVHASPEIVYQLLLQDKSSSACMIP